MTTNTDDTTQTMSHTPEPWHYEMHPSVSNIIAADPTGQNPYGTYIAEIDGEDVGSFVTYEQHEANARRICAAVNACQHIPTEALENGHVKELLKIVGGRFSRRANRTTQQADNSSQSFTVTMHPTLVDELDEEFSPMDGLVAIDQMFSELPLLHPCLAPKRRRNGAGRNMRVYRGCYDWYKSLGFSYIQTGTTLHVLELWYDENTDSSKLDVILGTGRTKGYTPFGEDPFQTVP